MKRYIQRFSLIGLITFAFAGHAQTGLKINNQGTQLDGYFFASPAADARKAPAIVALHGCGGMLRAQGAPNVRTMAYAKLLNAQGWHVLFVDSLTARGVTSVCGGNSKVTQTQRVTDVQAAVALLAKREDVDSSRIGIVGWSHGGATALLANDTSIEYVIAPRAVFAFYPGCGEANERTRAWRPAQPVLMQLGAADDWTSPAPCQTLAAQWKELVLQDTYANAHHGFDSNGSGLRAVYLDTPKGKKTVHTGGDPAAKAASQIKLITFFKEHFK